MILDKFRIDDKKALITGASCGIGQAIAVAYAEAGADIVLVSRKEEALRETAAPVEATGRFPLSIAASSRIRTLCPTVAALEPPDLRRSVPGHLAHAR